MSVNLSKSHYKIQENQLQSKKASRMRSLNFFPFFFCITKIEGSVQGVTVSEEQLGNLFNVLDDLKEDEHFEGSIDEVFSGQFEKLSENFKKVRFLFLSP